MNQHLSPAETAKRFGITIKALRLYEQRGLLKPLRTNNGTTGAAWRVYGSDQFIRLHQILALKRLGFSLGKIADLLVSEYPLDAILGAQEGVLAKESERVARALILIREARAKLAAGQALSIDDLTALTKETVMTKHPTHEELNKTMTPFLQKHLSPVEEASIKEMFSARPGLLDTGKGLMEEARALMESGDASSPAAMDLARRFRALNKQLTSGPSPLTTLQPKLKATVEDARSDPEAAKKMEVFGFIKKAVANLKEQEGTEGRG